MMDNKNFVMALKEVNEELRNQLAETKRKSLEWESIARRLLYDAKQSGVVNEFKAEWYTNEVKEAQGTFTKETNPNNL